MMPPYLFLETARVAKSLRVFSSRVFCAVLLLMVGAMLPFAASRAQEPLSEKVAQETAPESPAWLEDAVVYEIFPRHFSADGTLNAVTAKLDSLQRLGVNVLWIMPIHPIGAEHRLGPLGSPYSVRDYYAIDPDLGTKADFLQLVQAAHQRHMRVILDMVANHTAWDSVMMAHPEFYQHDAAGHVLSPHGWSDVAALNYANPALRKYMIDMFVYWLKNFDLDGFRCDAASFVPTDFWEQLRPELKSIRPDVLLLAEASKPELMKGAFDLDYGWPLMSTFNKVIEHGQPASSIETQINEQIATFPIGTRHMLISDDHDEQRATVRYGAPAALAASALVFTLPGVPMLYNGMEAGDATESGGQALFEKFRIYWGAAQQFPRFPEFYHTLIPLRASSPALRHGDLLWLHNSDEQHVVSFERRSPEETDLVVVNLSSTPFRGTLEAPSGDWSEVTFGKAKPVLPALPALSLEAFQVRIFRRLTPNVR
jgi:cyclomaltodextrinase / maltogenic alpha-amylase / neopullulanase